MQKFIVFSAGIVALVFASCNNPAAPVTNIYSISYNASNSVLAINNQYVQSYVTTAQVMIYDSAAKDSMPVYKFTGIGRCSCGADADLTYIWCDSSGRAVFAPADSGNFAMRVVADESAPFLHGNVVLTSFVKGLDKISASFTGYALDGSDTLSVTNGAFVAPAQ